MASLSRELVMREFEVPPLRQRGQVTTPRPPLARWISFKQWEQILCRHGNCFKSVNLVLHTEQGTSSRLSSKFFRSMMKDAKLQTWSELRVKIWLNQKRSWFLWLQTTNHNALYENIWFDCLLEMSVKLFPVFLRIVDVGKLPNAWKGLRDLLRSDSESLKC